MCQNFISANYSSKNKELEHNREFALLHIELQTNKMINYTKTSSHSPNLDTIKKNTVWWLLYSIYTPRTNSLWTDLHVSQTFQWHLVTRGIN